MTTILSVRSFDKQSVPCSVCGKLASIRICFQTDSGPNHSCVCKECMEIIEIGSGGNHEDHRV